MPRKQKSGLYRTKVKVGVDANGKDVLKWASGKTMRELEDARREIIECYVDATKSASDCLFGNYAIEWYYTYKKPHIAPSTQRSYKTMLNKHILPLLGDRNLRSISAGDLQRVMNRFVGSSGTQIGVAAAVLKGVFATAVQDRIIDRDPALHLHIPSPKPAKEKRALTEKERERLIRVCKEHKHGAYLAVMYYLGVRPGEARGLQWGDFDWPEGLVHIQRDIDYASNAAVGSLKTAAADRYVPVPTPLREILLPIRGFPTSFLFAGRDGKPLSQATAARWWIYLMRDAGFAERLPGSEHETDIRKQYQPLFTPHTLRHNYITICWEKGVDIMLTMKMVGHSDYKTTRDIYTHLSKSALDNAKGIMDKIFSESCTKVAQER